MLENSLSQEARFSSELNPKRGSLFAVISAYLVTIAAVIALVMFISSFREAGIRLEEMQVAQNRFAAIEHLVWEIDKRRPAAELEVTVAEYRQFAEQEAGVLGDEQSAVPGDRFRLADIDELERLASATGESRSQLAELAARIASDEASRVGLIQAELDEARRQSIVYSVLLAALVLLGAMGGAWYFLRRSRHLERLLKERSEELEEVDRSRRLFFAQASHELRTPVTAMRGEAEVALADNDMDLEAMRESLQHVVSYASFLGHRIEEMIGLARTADGKVHLKSDPLDLRDIVIETVRDARAYAESVEVDLRISVPDKAVNIVGDAEWLRRGLLAVIENALKFSPMEGSVSVELTVKDLVGHVQVSDEGPGVTPEELPLIFDAYYQTETGKVRGGSGLGLALARWVVEQHGGTARAENIGKLSRQGCRITLTIPPGRTA